MTPVTIILFAVIVLVLILDYILNKRKNTAIEDTIKKLTSGQSEEAIKQTKQKLDFDILLSRIMRIVALVVVLFGFIFFIVCKTVIPKYYFNKGNEIVLEAEPFIEVQKLYSEATEYQHAMTFASQHVSQGLERITLNRLKNKLNAAGSSLDDVNHLFDKLKTSNETCTIPAPSWDIVEYSDGKQSVWYKVLAEEGRIVYQGKSPPSYETLEYYKVDWGELKGWSVIINEESSKILKRRYKIIKNSSITIKNDTIYNRVASPKRNYYYNKANQYWMIFSDEYYPGTER